MFALTFVFPIELQNNVFLLMLVGGLQLLYDLLEFRIEILYACCFLAFDR